MGELLLSPRIPGAYISSVLAGGEGAAVRTVAAHMVPGLFGGYDEKNGT